MTFQDFEKMFPGFKGELTLYISGSQGVSPGEMTVEYGKNFTDLDSLSTVFAEFVDEHCQDYYEDYLEDCDYDEDDAFMECITDSGSHLLGIDEDHLDYEWDGNRFEKIGEF